MERGQSPHSYRNVPIFSAFTVANSHLAGLEIEVLHFDTAKLARPKPRVQKREDKRESADLLVGIAP